MTRGLRASIRGAMSAEKDKPAPEMTQKSADEENGKLRSPLSERAITKLPRDDNHGFNGRLVFAIAAAALGSAFQHGYNTGVVNAPQKLIEDWIKVTEHNRTDQVVDQSKVTIIWSIAVAIFCVGGMIGGAITGIVGRKGGLLLNNVLVAVAAIFEGVSKAAGSYEMIIIGRFFIGINSGLNAGLAPMYLAEISPVHLRGAVGTVYQLVITISILVSQILGLESILGTEESWPVLLAITVVPGIFQLVTLPICPESPKYLLLSKGQEMEAQRALTWLRGTIEVHDEMDDMRNEYEAMKLVPKVTIKEMFVNATLRIPLMIAMMVMVAQQLSGINAVMFFSTKIFRMAQLDDKSAQYATLGMGAVNVFMTLVSMVIVEKAGRKTLLLIGFAGMCVTTVLLTISLAYVQNAALWVSYVSILLVILFVVMFAIGPGSIPWFLVSELFNQSARGAATSLAVAVNWTANFIVGIGFLPLQEAMGGNVFIIFTILLALFVLFVYKKVPETKNKTIEEISSMFRQISYQ
ncbi:solute carrier family 2, facilitated glucose transporter member 1-like isoform X3 [Zootermopsis nevadensis]|uniref:solute carrier family 2, facilitated glucose transporter member 1-like isoform X2 n=2 Tax=Zootermopsis nevadensis TaxID=136037 RepID=UPI000B8EC632|nr:solute carrier family 2, facilitated glucose transporter member 1-like isoform X2 [Zootermopsis nevadensis]XP_021914509.1 solute carrier family 2, facilitated glucose transporter member 1-like isoform X3 [Zootermopsis nevadensis]